MQKASDSFVDQYFSRAIDLFKDDSFLNDELKQILMVLPQDLKSSLCLIYTDELTSLFDKETSVVLQQKCNLLFLIAYLSQSSTLEEVTLPLLLKVQFECRFQIQEKYYGCLFLNLYQQVRQADLLQVDIQTKTRIFTLALSGLSSKLSIVHCLCSLTLTEIQSQLNCGSISELLAIENGYFFNNMFAKLRYFNFDMSSNHLLLSTESLKVQAPQLLANHLIQLCEMIGQSVDSAMICLDQAKILTSMDMLTILTGFVHEQSQLSDEQCLIKPFKHFNDQQADSNLNKKTLTNVLRMQILRVQPYMTPNTAPQLAFKAIQIFQNCVHYLSNRPMVTESKAANFSAEDGLNVMIPCALSALAYELWSNIHQILKFGKPQIKTKIFDLLTQIAFSAPEFLVTSNRMKDIVSVQIRETVKSVADADMFQMLLLKSQAKLLNAFINWEQKTKDQSIERSKSFFETLEHTKDLKQVMFAKLQTLFSEQNKHLFEPVEMHRIRDVLELLQEQKYNPKEKE